MTIDRTVLGITRETDGDWLIDGNVITDDKELIVDLGDKLIVYGDIRVNGDIIVFGSLFATGRINATGSIKCTGSVRAGLYITADEISSLGTVSAISITANKTYAKYGIEEEIKNV